MAHGLLVDTVLQLDDNLADMQVFNARYRSVCLVLKYAHPTLVVACCPSLCQLFLPHRRDGDVKKRILTDGSGG